MLRLNSLWLSGLCRAEEPIESLAEAALEKTFAALEQAAVAL